MSTKINTNQLEPNSYFMIRGKVSFSRITRFMTKAEFDAQNQRKIQSGRPTDNRPYAHLSLVNCQVVCSDVNNKSINEEFAEQKLFTTPTKPETGWNYTAKQAGTFETMPDGSIVTTGYLPTVWVLDPTHHFQHIQPQGELANGMDVTVVMRVYKAAPNNGIALDRILCNEPIRYYAGGGNASQELAAKYGLTFGPVDASIDTHVTAQSYGAVNPAQAAAPAPMAPVAPAPAPAAAPAYAPAPAPAPAAANPNAFSTVPAAAPVPTPAAAPAPAPAAPVAPPPAAAPAYPAQEQAPVYPQAPAAAPAAPAAPAQAFGVPPTTFPSSPAAPTPAAPAAGGVTTYNPGTDPQRQY